jgi:hypothetical protein
MEDLGPGDSLADLLLGDDAARAADALLLWASTLGRALRPTLREGRRAERLDLRTDAERFRAFAAGFGCSGAVDAEVAAIEDELSAVTPWFAFGPSDACPDNNRLMADGSMRLFDFEGASWRHAASEAAYTRAPFCTCWCVAALPEALAAGMEDAFMDALDPPDPAGLRHAVDASAVAYVLQMSHVLAWLADSDHAMAPAGITAPARGRQYVHARLTMVARYTDRFPALAALAADVAAAMRTRWPDATPLPPYPAFL